MRKKYKEEESVFVFSLLYSVRKCRTLHEKVPMFMMESSDVCLIKCRILHEKVPHFVGEFRIRLTSVIRKPDKKDSRYLSHVRKLGVEIG